MKDIKEKNKSNILFEISVKPSKDSTSWLCHRSILATVFLWLLWLCRVFSILQILKYLVRKLLQWGRDNENKDSVTLKSKIANFLSDHYSIDRFATRADIPSWIPEVYFCFWVIIIFTMYITEIRYDFVCYYYLFETFVWILYYTIFRRFYEENYSIYHPLEYFMPLFVIFPTQALCLSILQSQSFGASIITILGGVNNKTPLYNVMGILYGAIVIGLIVDKFPEEKVKDRNIKVHIIGNGDVVKNRLVPALEKSYYDEKDLAIYDISEPKDNRNSKIVHICQNASEIIENIYRLSGKETIVYISCSSNAHIKYLEPLAKKAKSLLVCEKPICISNDDLNIVENLNSQNKYRDRIFYLSYYLLEKALPLYYFFKKNFRYTQYLNINGTPDFQQEKLGELETVKVEIIEGEDSRKLEGGQYFETLIHNVLIASLVCNNLEAWKNISIIENANNLCELTAEYEHAKIELRVEKNREFVSRTAVFNYKNGMITMNMDTGCLDVIFSNKNMCHIAIKEEYKAIKYSIQTDLVYRVSKGEFLPKEVDGLYLQDKTIEWMLKIK